MSATLTIDQAARLLGCSRNTAYAAARSGEIAGIPVIRIGARRLVIPRAPLEELLGISTPATNGKHDDDNIPLS